MQILHGTLRNRAYSVTLMQFMGQFTATTTQGEQATDAECTVPEANSCHRRRCECIAHGCDGPDCASEPAAQVEAFQRCGCQRYGNLIPAKTSGCACLEPGGIGGGGGDSYGYGTSYLSSCNVDASRLEFSGDCGWLSHDAIRSAFVRACELLIACPCDLPDDVRECLQETCCSGGSRTVKFLCKDSCSNESFASVRTGINLCIADKALLELCVNNIEQMHPTVTHEDPLVHIVGHELLHLCDCRKDKHTSGCSIQTSDPDVNVQNEAYAQACENACIGGDFPYRYTLPGMDDTYGRPGYQKDWCCKCTECAS